MSTKKYTRRDFFKTAGAVGAGSVVGVAPISLPAKTMEIAQDQGKVPTRTFGKSGIPVSMLSLGGMFDIPNNQLMLRQAIRWGVTYWDTADCYGGGRSENGIGKFFKRYPQERKNVFLVTKSDRYDPDGMTRLLERSLKRMNTDYVDLYFLHGVRNTRPLTEKVRKWAEETKSQGKIRLFGFSTHSNMETCLRDAAKLGWIDGIMMTYNYRLMHEPDMKAAVEACVDAGIGLTAMKTQGGGHVSASGDAELALAGRFLEQGYTDYQAKLKAVWENPQIAAICSQMPNMTILKENTAAAMDKTTLSSGDRQSLQAYATQTTSAYCAGCGDICESALEGNLPVADVMRFLMYARSYGDRGRAEAHLKQLPPETLERLRHADYVLAERRCPRGLAIGRLMQEAVRIV